MVTEKKQIAWAELYLVVVKCCEEDDLGSIMRLYNSSGTAVFSAYYDPWGVQTVTTNTIEFNRGYCGHEMLNDLQLINMRSATLGDAFVTEWRKNGRFYDPYVARFLSPDNYVQLPTSTQSFNRYSYCLNNPLKYVDPDGEFFAFTLLNASKDLFVNTFIKVWSQGFNAWSKSSNWDSTYKAFKIDMGMFKGNVKQIISRFTWEAPQSFLGHLIGSVQNTFYGVKSVSYYGGATAIEYYKGSWGAFTLGSFVNGQRGLYADPNNKLFQHEYGHYLQSQEMGLGYIPRIAIPSLISTMNNDGNHDFQPFEQDANRRAFLYFNENVEGFYKSFDEQYDDRGWNFYSNPLDVYHIGSKSRGDYYDYHNKVQMEQINSLALKAKWYDSVSWLGGIIGVTSIGIMNGIYYNNHRIR